MSDAKVQGDLRRLNEDGKRFVYRAATLLRTARIYSLDNQAMGYSLNVATSAANRLVERLGDVNLVGEGDTVHLNDYRIRVDRGMVPQIRFFNQFLHGRGIGGFKLDGQTTNDDWKLALQILMSAEETQDEELDNAGRLNAKLGDVGLGRAVDELQERTHMSTARLLGTPGFIDPLPDARLEPAIS